MSPGDRSPVLSLALAMLVAPAIGACRQTTNSSAQDAGTDRTGNDGPALLTLDIAVTGCTTYDPTTARCSGAAPITLAFSPVGSPELTGFKWTFGDGTPAVSARAPMHAYSLPGSYEVSLIGSGAVGNIASKHELTVVVDPRPAGSPCDVDAQCSSGLRCTCGPDAGCSPAFVRGLCSTACDSGFCGPGAVCAALALGPSPDGGPTPRSPFCVAACQGNADCAASFVCQTLPPAGASNSGMWIRGCLPLGALGDLGASCRNADGTLDDEGCATGTCADLGALGICTASCDTGHPCPDGTACSSVSTGTSNTGPSLCLIDCGQTNASCARDPLLACSAPPPADGGVTATTCRPKACGTDADCAPTGRCGPGGQCLRA